jgi:hypothetical protein
MSKSLWIALGLFFVMTWLLCYELGQLAGIIAAKQAMHP